MKKTKIIATIGPVTDSEEQIIKLYNSGVNVIRFNFSHANYESVVKTMEKIKKLNASGQTNLSTMLDTKGPEIRTGDLKEKLFLSYGEKIKIFVNNDKLEDGSIFCDYPYLLEDLEIGNEIVIDSGLCQVKVLDKYDDYLEVEVLNNCEIGNRRHINLPGVKLKLPGITDKDKQDIKFGIDNGFDFIAMSFVRNKDNIEELKEFLKENNAEHIKIISKIENQEGIENMDEIIRDSHGVMIARGDLGIEVPIEKMPLYQKQIVDKCLENGTFVIIATHLLETMIENPFPTRAEVSDIYNSVLQKADSLMLSGETTIGKFPIKSVKMMAGAIHQAEANMKYDFLDYSNKGLSSRDFEKKLLIKQAIYISSELNAKAIFIYTKTGLLARLSSAFRPSTNIYAFTPKESSVKFANILFGIKPYILDGWSSDYSSNVEKSIQQAKDKGIIISGDKIIAISDIQKSGKEFPILEIVDID